MKASHSRLAACVVALAALLHFALAPRPVDTRATAGAVTQRDVRRAIVISLDGLDVRYIRKADEYGLKIPTLRRLARDGFFAGVESVYPSVTYPNHTTMVTGTLPVRHGIMGNAVFEPPTSPQTNSWYWYARDLKADALWDAAGRKGLKTALVSWPVSTGAGDWNVPEIWKPGSAPNDSFPNTLAEITKHARPAGLVEEIAKADPEIYKNVTKDEGDDMRTRWAEYLILKKRPDLLLVHLFDLDHFEHDHGPFTPEAFAILEKVDGYVARIVAAAERAGTLPETAVFITSDHGFRTISKEIRPGVILARAGLINAREEKTESGRVRAVVSDWTAAPYTAGGSAGIILREKGDLKAKRRARAALEEFNRRAGGDLYRVVEGDVLRKLGAFPGAALVLEAGPGHYFSHQFYGEPISESKGRGMHGYLPMPDDYRATFIGSGLDVIKRGDLGTIHMTEVGPTVAAILGVKLRDAQARALKLK